MTTQKPSLLKTILKVPQEADLALYLAEKQKDFKTQIRNFAVFFIFFFVAFGFNPWAALATINGIFLHELGHWLIYVINGSKAFVRLIVPLGAIAIPANKDEKDKFNLLPWSKAAEFFLSGPAFNVLQMIIGLWLVQIGFLPELGHQMIVINGVLALYNLLPISNMDGGQFFKVIFSSLEERYDRIVALVGLALAVLVIGLIILSPIGQGAFAVLKTFVFSLGQLSFLVLLAAGIWKKQNEDDPTYCKSAQAMSTKQVTFHLLRYAALIAVTLTILVL